jgi:hypothetical protein
MRQLLSVAVTAVLLVSPTIACQVDYFPPGTLDETPQASRAKEQWYSGQLRALKEPSLWESFKTQKTQTYRFLWLRTFNHPISVRLDINQDGTGLLTTKATSGQGGYRPGKLVMNKTRKLTKEQTDWFLDRIAELGFWGLPAFEKDREAVGPNGEKTVEIGVDGAQWILEDIKDGKYQIADRWSPETGPVRTLGIIMVIDLAKLKLLYEEVY